MARPTPERSVRVDSDDDSGRPAWLPWLIGLLLLLLIALALFFLLNDDDEDEDTAAQQSAPTATAEASSPSPSPTPSPSATPSATGAAGPISLAPPFTSIDVETSQEVVVSQAQVVDVPADAVFTIGSPDSELVVYITEEARSSGAPESATNVEPGSTVTQLQGTLLPVSPEFLTAAGLEGEGAETAKELGVYIAASSFELASP